VLLLFDSKVRLPALFSHYVVGLLVGNVLPSTIGGDVLRVTRAAPKALRRVHRVGPGPKAREREA